MKHIATAFEKFKDQNPEQNLEKLTCEEEAAKQTESVLVLDCYDDHHFVDYSVFEKQETRDAQHPEHAMEAQSLEEAQGFPSFQDFALVCRDWDVLDLSWRFICIWDFHLLYEIFKGYILSKRVCVLSGQIDSLFVNQQIRVDRIELVQFIYYNSGHQQQHPRPCHQMILVLKEIFKDLKCEKLVCEPHAL